MHSESTLSKVQSVRTGFRPSVQQLLKFDCKLLSSCGVIICHVTNECLRDFHNSIQILKRFVVLLDFLCCIYFPCYLFVMRCLFAVSLNSNWQFYIELIMYAADFPEVYRVFEGFFPLKFPESSPSYPVTNHPRTP